MQIVFILMLATLGAEDWSRFRGPNGSGIADDAGYPVEFGPEKNLVWRTAVRPGKSSPVLTKSSVFVTGFQEGKLYTQCFDRATGKLRWERSEARAHAGSMNLLNHPAGASPVTDGENVYVFFKDFGLLSYSADGKLRWRVPLGPFVNSMGLGVSPILAGDLVILQADQVEGSYIAAYSKSNGELRWKTAREESESWGTPVLYQGNQILTVGAGHMGAHRVADGKRTLLFPGASPIMVASPVVDGDVVYAFGYGVGGNFPFSRQLAAKDKNGDGKISPDEYTDKDSVLRATGWYMGNRDGTVTEEEWQEWTRHVGGAAGMLALQLGSEPKTLWRVERGFESVIPSPLLHDGLLYVVKDGGILLAYDAKTGQMVKTARLTGALGGYSASPVMAAGRIYLASEEGKIAVVKPGREWEVERVNEIGDPFFATPALAGGRIYARGDGALYCFGARQ